MGIVAKMSSPYRHQDGGETTPSLFYDIACDQCGDVIAAIDDGVAVSPVVANARSEKTGDWKNLKAQPVVFLHGRCIDSWVAGLPALPDGEFFCSPIRAAIAELANRVIGKMTESAWWEPIFSKSSLKQFPGVALSLVRRLTPKFS